MEKQQIRELLSKKDWPAARNLLITLNVVDIAEFLENLDTPELIKVFRLLPKELSAEVFAYIPNEVQLKIVEKISDKEIKYIINELFFDDTIDFIEEMPSNVVKRVLRNSDPETRKLINQFLNYPESSAGSLMTIEYVSLKKTMTAGQALEHIRKNAIDKETINTCYVTSAGRELLGAVSIRALILAEPDEKVANLMNTAIISAGTLDDQEDIAQVFKKYDLSALPIVDKENRLVGIITIDDIVEVIEQENTEDFQKMAAMTPSDKEYLKETAWALASRRILWLLVLMVSATFTGYIIRGYEAVLMQSAILASFIPMLMDTGGNAGSQSSTLIIRGIALAELETRDFLKVAYKELSVGIITGSSLALINFVKIMLIDNLLFHAAIEPMVSVVVCISLMITVVTAKFVGGILPLIANKLKMDPAIMAGPLITTVVDAVALLVYFSLSVKMLGL